MHDKLPDYAGYEIYEIFTSKTNSYPYFYELAATFGDAIQYK